MEHDDAALVFQHACKLGFEGIISKRKEPPCGLGRPAGLDKLKNSQAPAVPVSVRPVCAVCFDCSSFPSRFFSTPGALGLPNA
jgi:hypothetical protein